jgi:hypothetical protein
VIKIDRRGAHRVRCSVGECDACIEMTAIPMNAGMDRVLRLDHAELGRLLASEGWVVGAIIPKVLMPGNGPAPGPEPMVLCPKHADQAKQATAGG